MIAHAGTLLDARLFDGGTGSDMVSGAAGQNAVERALKVSGHLTALAGNVENDLMYEVSQKFDLGYLPFSPELTEHTVERYKLEGAPMPPGLLRGIEKPMTTLARNGQSAYGRDDLGKSGR
jgi:hypothetical protein